MRLDKFLKVSRLIKRRTVANDLSSGGGVEINGKVAKPASLVHVGDELLLKLGRHRLRVVVLQVPVKAVPAQLADSLYRVLEDTYDNGDTVDQR